VGRRLESVASARAARPPGRLAGLIFRRAFQEIEGVGGRAREDVLVQHLFSQGADEGFTVELAMIVLLGARQDVVDMERLLGGNEYNGPLG
jgi:hypothetical protein